MIPITNLRALFLAISFFGTLYTLYLFFFQAPYGLDFPVPNQEESWSDLSPCIGPRGVLLPQSEDDQVVAEEKEHSYPQPLWGSYQALGMPMTWLTADARYGPYGLGEDSETYNRTVVDWEQVDWAQLQNQCFARNRKSFPASKDISTKTKFRFRSLKNDVFDTFSRLRGRPSSTTVTGQTAIVLRTWDTYTYRPEDFWHLRSIITETALSSMGKYAVFLLVDIHDPERRRRMHQSNKEYETVLAETVPKEFWSMAILFDETMLASWYPLVDSHSAQFQMYQATQLLSTIYTFDHYWQIEMDAKFLVHTDHYLSALSEFSRQEPREQAIQRAAYRYMPDSYPTYEAFIQAVNKGQTSPHRQAPQLQASIPDIPRPIDPEPPHSAEIDFFHGVGEAADVLLTNTLVSVLDMTYWVYHDWIQNFSLGTETPRLQSPVSITRSSHRLLQAIHKAQMDTGLAVPSEATAPSFAFWNNLKISYPPAPWFMRRQHQRNVTEWEMMFNGGPVEGAPKGPSLYNPKDYWDYANDGTWHFAGSWPRDIMDAWLGINQLNDDTSQKELPWILMRDEQGRVWAPSVALHPVKTN